MKRRWRWRALTRAVAMRGRALMSIYVACGHAAFVFHVQRVRDKRRSRGLGRHAGRSADAGAAWLPARR